MDNVAELKRLVTQILVLISQPEPQTLKEVLAMLDAIASPEKSESWKLLGDALLDEAKKTSTSDADALFLIVVGSSCVGVSIRLKREENRKASQA